MFILILKLFSITWMELYMIKDEFLYYVIWLYINVLCIYTYILSLSSRIQSTYLNHFKSLFSSFIDPYIACYRVPLLSAIEEVELINNWCLEINFCLLSLRGICAFCLKDTVNFILYYSMYVMMTICIELWYIMICRQLIVLLLH